MATIRKRTGPQGRTVWQAQIIRLGYPPQYQTFDSKGAADAWACRSKGMGRRWSEWPGRRDRTGRHERRDAIAAVGTAGRPPP